MALLSLPASAPVHNSKHMYGNVGRSLQMASSLFMLLSTVGYACAVQDFVQLLDWCETDLQRVKAVQRVLKLIRGWDTAAAHARIAVPEDNRPRLFTAAEDVVLKYTCKLGQINFKRFTGHAWRKSQHALWRAASDFKHASRVLKHIAWSPALKAPV